MTDPLTLNVPTAAITLLTGFLMYRIKLIDDRERDNIQRYKNYYKRRILNQKHIPEEEREHRSRELETWLNKDAACIMIFGYKLNKSDTGALDYYRDYKDCETDKREIYFLTALNIIYLSTYGFLPNINWLKLTFTFLIIGLFYYVCTRKDRVNLFNNHLVNTDNSDVAKSMREETEKMLDKDYKQYIKRYKIRNPA